MLGSGTFRDPQGAFLFIGTRDIGTSSIDMTQANNNLAEGTEEGINFLSIVVMGLLFLLIWKITGMQLSFSPNIVSQVKELSYQQVEDRAAGHASLSEILTWLMMASVGLALHIVNKDRALSTWARAWPLGALLLLVVLSILWSSVPDIALRRVVKQLFLIAVVAGIVMGATSPRQIVGFTVLVTGALMAMNCAAVLLFHGAATGPAGEFKGFLDHKNTAGQFAMVTIFVWFAAARWSSGIWLKAGLYCGTLVWFLFLLGTDARTSILATIAAIVAVVILRHCIRWPAAGIIFGLSMLFLFLCGVFALISFNISFSDLIASIEGRRTTFSGRGMVWQIAYNAFLEHKVLGTGYGSLWDVGGLPAVQVYTDLHPTTFLLGLSQAHNGYFDILATLGLVGAVVFFVFLANFAWNGVTVLAESEKYADSFLVFDISVLIFVGSVLNNVAETSFLRNSLIWTILIFCYLTLCSTKSSTDHTRPVSVAESGPNNLHLDPRRTP
jgi:O-antigen ligase